MGVGGHKFNTMPKKVKLQNPPARKPAQKKNKKANSAVAVTAQSGRSSHLYRYLRMVADPCRAPLEYPMYGGTENGYLLRVRSTFTLHATAANNNGSFVWFPDFHNSGSGVSNCFGWEFNNTGGPTNTIAVPMGTGGAGGLAYQDPAHSWVISNNVASARTIAACITFNYVGPTTSAAGQVAYLSGIQRLPVVAGGAAGAPVSTAEYFVLTDKTTRTPLMQLENKFVPTDGSRFFRTAGGAALAADAGFIMGVPATSNTVPGTSIAADTYGGIGFAWRGLSSASNNDVIIELVKVIEWKPDPASGGQLPTAPQTESASWELFSTAVRRVYNSVRYGMDTPAMDSLVQGVSNMALGAAGMAMRQTTQRMIMRA